MPFVDGPRAAPAGLSLGRGKAALQRAGKITVVEFSSGGGGRDRLDQSLATSGNNVYGLLYGDMPDAQSVAESFVGLGWGVRKAAWDEVEVTNEWCSFLLGSPGGQLKLAGVVAPGRLDDLGAALAAAGQTYSLELYDGNDLVRETQG